jgi:hypothetical protein
MSRELFHMLNDLNIQAAAASEGQANNLHVLEQRLKDYENSFTYKEEVLDIIKKFECRLVEKELFLVQDMHNYIHTNPYLKTTEAKTQTFDRYVGIFKNNHADDLDKPVYCHHSTPDENTTLIQAVDEYIANH